MKNKIKTLAFAKHFIIKGFIDLIYNLNEESINEFYGQWSKYFEVISDLLNLEIRPEDLFSDKINPDEIISIYLNSAIYEDVLVYDIDENYGSELKNYYCILTTIAALQYITSFHIHGNILENVVEERIELIKRELGIGDKFILFFIENYSSINYIHTKYFSPEAVSLFESLKQIMDKEKMIDYISIHEISSKIINEIYPSYQELDFNLKLAEKLISTLTQCEPGIKNWKNYESTCIKIIRYLFIPEFENIFYQKRTESGHQIRDVIIPNNQHSGFWKNIKDEFNSKNIVCEFKNGLKNNITKESINQLRIYLSKKTIGRFGFLFIRNKPSKSLLIARKLAYEESNILIIFIDDSLLKKLIVSRALIGKCDDLLIKEKVKFEVEY